MRVTRTRRRRRCDRRGSAALELALMTPLLTSILLVTVDYARLFADLSTVTDCARHGALYYAGNPTAPAANVRQATLADAGGLGAHLQVISSKQTDSSGTETVRVTVTYAYNSITGLAPATLQRKVVMLVTPT